jgi:hypothetical protein
MRDPARWCVLLAAAWLGLLVCVAAIATPSAFAALPAPEAGRVAARVLAREAAVSLLFGAVLALMLRALARRRSEQTGASQFTPELALALGALFCTVAGYYGLQPLMSEARAGAGRFSFGQLHTASLVFYGLKLVLVAALAWRCSRPGGAVAPGAGPAAG